MRCWARSYQPWPVEQAADLHHPHIVVGVAERRSRGSGAQLWKMKIADAQSQNKAVHQRHCRSTKLNGAARVTRHKRFFSFQAHDAALVAPPQRASGASQA